jgi:phosphatidylglycerophosphate synthase
MTGDPSAGGRVFSALLPALVVLAYFVLGYVAYNIRCLVWGPPRQYERDARGRTALVGYHLRFYFFWVIEPVWKLVLRSGLSANAVTAIACLFGLGAAVAASLGAFAAAGWLFLFSGIFDVLDGRLARARNEVSPAGAAIDSILDRYTDSLMLVGLAIYFRESWVLVAALLALVGTSLVPYVRAKSEALGFPVRDGLMQRTERLLYLGGSVALSPILDALLYGEEPHSPQWLAAAGVVFLAVTSNITAVARFRALVRSINEGARSDVAKRPKAA